MTYRSTMPQLRRWISLSALLSCAACGSSDNDAHACTAGDQDGVIGGNNTVLLNVSDTGYAVGGVNSGSTQPNIAVQNSSNVRLTMTNVGSKPHGLRVACIPTDLPAGCPAVSCFPDSANIPAIDPGTSATVTFATPAVEGAYSFTSEEPGDTSTDSNGTLVGLVGQFVLM